MGATQTRPRPADTDYEIDAGVIEDARRRQRRHRTVGAAALIGSVAALGVIFGLSNGGAGSSRAGHSNGYGPKHGVLVGTSSRVGVPVAAAPPTIGASGLLRPGVGWAANGLGFYMTWDGGRLWSKITVPGLGGDVFGNLTTVTSPDAHTLILAFAGGSVYGTCAGPGPGGSVNHSVGDVAVSSDSGRTWRTFAVPGCRVITQLSAVSARTAFAMSAAAKADGPELLYRSTDGARNWQRVGQVPAQGPIEFTSRRQGWLLGSNRLYRTSDGGRSWSESSACHSKLEGETYCGLPQFFGSYGVLQAVGRSEKSAGTGLIYATSDAGARWTSHRIRVHATDGNDNRLPTAFATPAAHTIYIYLLQGTLAKSTDGGTTWTGLPAPRFDGGTTLDFANSDYGWLQDGGHIFATRNGGRSWTELRQRRPYNPPVPQRLAESDTVSQLCRHPLRCLDRHPGD